MTYKDVIIMLIIRDYGDVNRASKSVAIFIGNVSSAISQREYREASLLALCTRLPDCVGVQVVAVKSAQTH